MNKFIYILLAILPVAINAEILMVFEKNIEITEQCKIKSTDKKGEVKYTDLDLPNTSNCKFINYDETNLIHMEQIANFYLFLVESTFETQDGCVSNHTAIAINEKGEVSSADFSKKSLSCNIDREAKLFKHFAHEMKLIN